MAVLLLNCERKVDENSLLESGKREKPVSSAVVGRIPAHIRRIYSACQNSVPIGDVSPYSVGRILSAETDHIYGNAYISAKAFDWQVHMSPIRDVKSIRHISPGTQNLAPVNGHLNTDT